jgi:hypothetical protein
MSDSGLVRWGAIGLILGGVTWLVLGLSAVFGYLQAIPGRAEVWLFIIAHLFTAVGLVGLHALQRGKLRSPWNDGSLPGPRRDCRPYHG